MYVYCFQYKVKVTHGDDFKSTWGRLNAFIFYTCTVRTVHSSHAWSHLVTDHLQGAESVQGQLGTACVDGQLGMQQTKTEGYQTPCGG